VNLCADGDGEQQDGAARGRENDVFMNLSRFILRRNEGNVLVNRIVGS
jgi:hypothetical protein